MTLDMDQLEGQVTAMVEHRAQAVDEVVRDRDVLLALIQPSRWQPRQSFDGDGLWELAKSIRENGLINPVVVFPVEGGPWLRENGAGYELVAGERRTRAVMGLTLAQQFEQHTPKEYVLRLAAVGMDGLNEAERTALATGTIRAHVMAPPATEDDLARLHRVAIVENLERENLGPLEEAHGLAGLIEAYGWSQRELARQLGRSAGWVRQRLALLELPRAAREAVSTRVLTMTHARALHAVPETARETMAREVIERVERGATTREIEELAGQVAEFLDQDRYLPEDRVYLPEGRNRLALLRWLVANQCEHEGDIDAVIALEQINIAGKSVDGYTLEYTLEKVVQAFGFASLEEAWSEFAAKSHRRCPSCKWAEFSPRVWSDWRDPPCRRWNAGDAVRGAGETKPGDDVITCQAYVGKFDPQVVALSYDLREAFDALEVEYEEEPFAHVVGIEAFVDHYDDTLVWREEQEQEEQARHVDEIRAFWAWQAELEQAWLEHFRAHACETCANYEAELDPPCRLVREPLRNDFGERNPRAPRFGALVTRVGWMLPRCEGFAYRRNVYTRTIPSTTRPASNTSKRFLSFRRSKGVVLEYEQFARWMRYVLESATARSRHTIWSVLQWLDRGEQELVEYLCSPRFVPNRDRAPNPKWSEIMATLLDVAMSEARPALGGDGTIELLNPITLEVDRFVAVDIDVIWCKRERPRWKKYPEEWPKPWRE